MTCSNPKCLNHDIDARGRCRNCHALSIGALVRHRYKVVKMLGKGGFGITYLVTDQDCLNETRVLKELCPNNSDSQSEDFADTAERLFKREAQMLLKLQHPGIPKLYAYFMENSYTYLVQDYIPGHTLYEEVETHNRPFGETEACAVLTELADILEYLHSCEPPIMHRDIKPQNIMRHQNGQIMLIDFGAVCQAVNNAGFSQTLIGSPGYSPPEQLLGQAVPQSDLYAAGVTVVRLLTGFPPNQLFNARTQRLEWETCAEVSPAFAALLNDLLLPDVTKRLANATELKRRLKELTSPPAVAVSADAATAESATMLELGMETSPLKVWRNSSPTCIFDEVKPPVPTPANQAKPPDELAELSEMPLLFLLRRFYHHRLSGILTCTDSSSVKTIHIEKGRVVFASSTLQSERLGEMLLRIGRIMQKDFDQASAIMEERGVRFGAALIELGRITVDELKPLIAEQFANIVYSLFEWTSGWYRIRQERPPEEAVKVSVSIPQLILEGLRRMKSVETIKHWLGDLTQKVTVTEDQRLLEQVSYLTQKERLIVTRLDQPMSVQKLASVCDGSEAEIVKAVCGLLAIGIFEWIEADSAPKAPAVPVLQTNFDYNSAAVFCYEIEDMMRSIESATHYAVLGLERSASDKEIKDAYAAMSLKFHPDRNVLLANYNFSLRSELEKIHARIQEAYQVLSNSRLRQEYDASLRLKAELKPNLQRRNTGQFHIFN